MDILNEEIPVPDATGSANTQQRELTTAVIPQHDSPLTMGHTITGLAVESGQGFNRQSSRIVAKLLDTTDCRLQKAEGQLQVLLPENAALKVRIKALTDVRKINSILSVLATLMASFGTSFLATTPPTSLIAGAVLVLASVFLYSIIFFYFLG